MPAMPAKTEAAPCRLLLLLFLLLLLLKLQNAYRLVSFNPAFFLLLLLLLHLSSIKVFSYKKKKPTSVRSFTTRVPRTPPKSSSILVPWSAISKSSQSLPPSPALSIVRPKSIFDFWSSLFSSPSSSSSSSFFVLLLLLLVSCSNSQECFSSFAAVLGENGDDDFYFPNFIYL